MNFNKMKFQKFVKKSDKHLATTVNGVKQAKSNAQINTVEQYSKRLPKGKTGIDIQGILLKPPASYPFSVPNGDETAQDKEGGSYSIGSGISGEQYVKNITFTPQFKNKIKTLLFLNHLPIDNKSVNMAIKASKEYTEEQIDDAVYTYENFRSHIVEPYEDLYQLTKNNDYYNSIVKKFEESVKSPNKRIKVATKKYAFNGIIVDWFLKKMEYINTSKKYLQSDKSADWRKAINKIIFTIDYLMYARCGNLDGYVCSAVWDTMNFNEKNVYIHWLLTAADQRYPIGYYKENYDKIYDEFPYLCTPEEIELSEEKAKSIIDKSYKFPENKSERLKRLQMSRVKKFNKFMFKDFNQESSPEKTPKQKALEQPKRAPEKVVEEKIEHTIEIQNSIDDKVLGTYTIIPNKDLQIEYSDSSEDESHVHTDSEDEMYVDMAPSSSDEEILSPKASPSPVKPSKLPPLPKGKSPLPVKSVSREITPVAAPKLVKNPNRIRTFSDDDEVAIEHLMGKEIPELHSIGLPKKSPAKSKNPNRIRTFYDDDEVAIEHLMGHNVPAHLIHNINKDNEEIIQLNHKKAEPPKAKSKPKHHYKFEKDKYIETVIDNGNIVSQKEIPYKKDDNNYRIEQIFDNKGYYNAKVYPDGYKEMIEYHPYKQGNKFYKYNKKGDFVEYDPNKYKSDYKFYDTGYTETKSDKHGELIHKEVPYKNHDKNYVIEKVYDENGYFNVKVFPDGYREEIDYHPNNVGSGMRKRRQIRSRAVGRGLHRSKRVKLNVGDLYKGNFGIANNMIRNPKNFISN